MTDPWASTPGSHVRRDDTGMDWREPADRTEAHRLLAAHRRGEVDVFALADPGETAHAAREMWVQEQRAAQTWARTAIWTQSRAYYPAMPSPAPPPWLAEWSPALRKQYGVAARYDEYVRNRAEAHRLTATQNDAYARRSA